jgi:hypothetical protein
MIEEGFKIGLGFAVLLLAGWMIVNAAAAFDNMDRK